MLSLTKIEAYNLELLITNIIHEEIMISAINCSHYINELKHKEFTGFSITGAYHLPRDEIITDEITFNCMELTQIKNKSIHRIQRILTHDLENIDMTSLQKYHWNEDIYNAISSGFSENDISNCIQRVGEIKSNREMNVMASVIKIIKINKGKYEMMKCISSIKIGRRVMANLINNNIILILSTNNNIEGFGKKTYNNIYILTIALFILYIILKQ